MLSDFIIPTADVYRKFDLMRLGDRAAVDAEPDWMQWADLSAGLLLEKLINDLEPPAMALCQQLATLRAEMEKIFARPVRMSGSGSSLFTLFENQAEANEAVRRIQDRRDVRAVVAEIAPTIADDLK